jgi:hypothetical protein
MPKTVSREDRFPKLLKVSTQITGNMIRLIMGMKSKIVHQVGRPIIFIKTMALYTGIAASQRFLPAASYNFQVPKK